MWPGDKGASWAVYVTNAWTGLMHDNRALRKIPLCIKHTQTIHFDFPKHKASLTIHGAAHGRHAVSAHAEVVRAVPTVGAY